MIRISERRSILVRTALNSQSARMIGVTVVGSSFDLVHVVSCDARGSSVCGPKRAIHAHHSKQTPRQTRLLTSCCVGNRVMSHETWSSPVLICYKVVSSNGRSGWKPLSRPATYSRITNHRIPSAKIIQTAAQKMAGIPVAFAIFTASV